MILVTGATGVVGRHLVELLLAEGVSVRAVTRDPAATLPDGVDAVVGDPSRPATLAAAMQGVHAVFVHPRAMGQGRDPGLIRESTGELLRLARDNGVTKAVAMSALNVDHPLDQQPSRLRGEYNKEVEAATVESGLQWTAVRPGYFATNTITSWAAQIRHGDVVRSAYGQSAWAPLHERDIAAVAAHALLHDDLAGHKPVLTGPEVLTQADMIDAIGKAIGRPLHYEEVPHEAARAAMARGGLPEPIIDGFLKMQAISYLQPGLVSKETENILGRPGLTFAQWAVEHAGAFTP
ncbi:SDR family oxidoreductase [Nonomuraea zeae]|uniref:NAD-dependent epimerase/dehydratase family protein n=1 Tax=Nonomuraea zeae TaxID=1642303 RepID=A0A5S4G9L4_9ACTN|nr:NAD(P)H-binding protein [Nonomuraea zeae]TMR29708.1 NAD-dependent epimerase/dehydratase family protein [Nonomuraea zeae]